MPSDATRAVSAMLRRRLACSVQVSASPRAAASSTMSRIASQRPASSAPTCSRMPAGMRSVMRCSCVAQKAGEMSRPMCERSTEIHTSPSSAAAASMSAA